MGVLLSLLFITTTHATSVPINNAGFESDKPDCPPNTAWYNRDNPTVSGWTEYNPSRAKIIMGVANPQDGDIMDDTIHGSSPPEGNSVVFINTDSKTSGDGEFGIEQTLSATLAPNTRYTLTANVGNPGNNCFSDGTYGAFCVTGIGFTGYIMQLLAGDEILVQDDNSIYIDDYHWTKSTVQFITTSSHSQLGNALKIRLLEKNDKDSGGLTLYFDDVTLDASLTNTTNPSLTPTANPSLYPSSTPSSNPSLYPSSSPSSNPSSSPSSYPSSNPSSNPSNSPIVPSAAPTKQPHYSPTIEPTNTPTNLRTSAPTKQPLSYKHTNVSTVTPSMAPIAQNVEIFYYDGFAQPYALNWSVDIGSYDPDQGHIYTPIEWRRGEERCPRATAGDTSTDAMICVHTAKDAYISRIIPTTGFHSIHLQIDVEARGVEIVHGDWCIIQYRTAATNWSNVNIIQGYINYTLNYDVIIPDNNVYNDQESFEVKVGIAANAGGDNCYFDNLKVSGVSYTEHTTMNPSQDGIRDTEHATMDPSPTFTPEDEGEDISGSDSDANINYVVFVIVLFIFIIVIIAVVKIKKRRTNKVERELSRIPGEIGKEEALEIIKLWLKQTVMLPQYYDVFIQNGYEKTETIMKIEDKSQLNELGITKIGHQRRIMSGIERLKHIDRFQEEGFRTKKGEQMLKQNVPIANVLRDASHSLSVQEIEMKYEPGHIIQVQSMITKDNEIISECVNIEADEFIVDEDLIVDDVINRK